MLDDSAAESSRLEELLRRCLEVRELHGPEAVEALCEDHPEFAAEIRRAVRLERPESGARGERDDPTQFHPPPGPPLAETESVGAPRIDHYLIQEELGKGGFGVVFRALDTRLERTVALKQLAPHLQGDVSLVSRLRREARLLASLDHPGIGRIYTLEESEDGIYLVLEYIEGETLAAVLERGPLSVARLTKLAVQICAALEAAHSVGIVHRDLKPANVMLTPQGQIKVLDLGIAKSLGRALTGDSTDHGLILGTPRYMSTEQLLGSAVTEATDVWAFGCVAFECLTGIPAFPQEGGAELSSAILAGEPDWTRLPESSPASLVTLLETCLSKDARMRPSGFGAIRERLESIDPEARAALPVVQDDLEIRVSCLRRRVRLGDRVPMRVAVRNRGDREATVSPRLGDEDKVWLSAGSNPDAVVAGGETKGVLVWVEAREAGDFLAPSVKVLLDRAAPVLLPGSSRIVVEEPAPDLQGRGELIQRVLNEGLTPTGELVLIGGPRGSGKTSFLEELSRIVRRRGLRELRGFAFDSQNQPLKVFHDLLRDLVGVTEVEHRGEALRNHARRSLSEYLGGRSSAVDFFLGELLGEDHAELSEGLRHYQWFRLYACAATETPLILLLDDLHRADRSSLELLRGLLARSAAESIPILAIGTLRADPRDASTLEEMRAFFDEEGVGTESHFLDPLGPLEVQGMLDERFPGVEYQDDLPWLVNAILTRSEGNPAFVDGILRFISSSEPDTACFQEVEGRWTLEGTPSEVELLQSFPLHYSDSLAQRLQECSGVSRTVLELASRLGVEFPVSVLERVVSEAELDEALDTLEAEGLITPAGDDLAWYRFTSNLIPEIMGEVLAKRQRAYRKMCRQLAEAAAAEFGQSDWHMEWIGGLFASAGDRQRAADYLLRGLRTYTYRGDHAHAVSLLQELSPLAQTLDSSPGEVEFLLLQGKVNIGLGRFEEARRSTEQALDAARRGGKTGLVARSLLQTAEIELRLSRWSQAAGPAQEALEQSRELEDQALILRSLNTLGLVRRQEHRPEEEHQHYGEAATLLSSSSDARDHMMVFINLGQASQQLGRVDEARRHFSRALETAEEVGHLDLATVARVGLANLEYAEGLFGSARDEYERAIEACRNLQNRRGLARNYKNLCDAERMLGRLDRALFAARRSADIRQQIGDVRGEAVSRGTLGILLAEIGHRSEARAEITRSRELAGSIGDPGLVSEFLLRWELLAGPDDVSPENGAELEDSVELGLVCALQCRRASIAGARLEPEAHEAALRALADLQSPLCVEARCLLLWAYAPFAGQAVDVEVLLTECIAQCERAPGVPVELLHARLADLQPEEAPVHRRAASEAIDRRSVRMEDEALRDQFVSAARSRIEDRR